jgi:uncharacterized protein with HEPN domain
MMEPGGLPDDDRVRLEHMLESVHWAVLHAGQSEEEFRSEPIRQHATVRMLQVLGDAAKAVSNDVKLRLLSIPWRDMARMRDLLVHHYFAVDPGVVWRTIERDLPTVRDALVEALRSD